jgi:cation transport regulator ChaC
VAYRVPAEDLDSVLPRLDHRERDGYERLEVDLMLRPGPSSDLRTVRGTVYVAGPGNERYLGSASLASIAAQVVGASGPSGPNADYVVELARSLRGLGVEDPHVFALEAEVVKQLGGVPEGPVRSEPMDWSGRS